MGFGGGGILNERIGSWVAHQVSDSLLGGKLSGVLNSRVKKSKRPDKGVDQVEQLILMMTAQFKEREQWHIN